MKKLVYKIHKIDENGHAELILRGDEEEVKKKWSHLDIDENFNYDLSCGWELNGKSLGVTLIESK